MSVLLVTTVSSFRKGFMPAMEAAGFDPNNKWPEKIKMGRQPRSGDDSLAIGPFDPERDRR